MSPRKLRWLRGLLMLAVLLVLLLVFALGGPLSEPLAPAVAHTQFVPALLRLFATGGLAAGASVLVIVLLTILAGRWYCSCLCPLGVLQDISRACGRLFPISKKRQDRRRKPGGNRRILRGWVLVATIISATAGSLVLLNLLDPYSIAGRTVNALVRPLATHGQRGASFLLEKADIYALSGTQPIRFGAFVATITAILMLLPLVMAFFRGRLYCNSICPVGALLATLSRFSQVRIHTKDHACTGCGLCARACRADCISLDENRKARANPAECILCFDCISRCPEDALSYTMPALGTVPDAADGRREVLALGAASAAAIVALPLRSLASAGFIPQENLPVIPPGGISFDHFASACTGCHLCVAACPGNVIQPKLARHGGAGVFQPSLDFLAGSCDYDCTICSHVCPNGALLPLAMADKHRLQIGTVELHENLCVVYKRGEECGACVEVCPTHAVYGEVREGILYPVTDSDFCVGCGACENVCPQNPRAITVDALDEHGTALDPLSEDHPSAAPAPVQADPSLETEEFPF